jgi:hypothetical protein
MCPYTCNRIVYQAEVALDRCCVGLLVLTDNDTLEHLMHGEMGCAILQFRNEQLSQFQLLDWMYETTEILWFSLTVGMKLTFMYVYNVLIFIAYNWKLVCRIFFFSSLCITELPKSDALKKVIVFKAARVYRNEDQNVCMMLEINVMQCIALVDLSYDFGCRPRLSKVPPPWPAVISSEWRFREMRISKLPCQQGGHFALV